MLPRAVGAETYQRTSEKYPNMLYGLYRLIESSHQSLGPYRPRTLALVTYCLVLIGCGGGGGGGGNQALAPVSPTTPTQGSDFSRGVFSPASNFQAQCGAPRQGTDPFTGGLYPDQPGDFLDENYFLRSWSNDTYLWYDEINDVDPAVYDENTNDVRDYFDLLRTFALTPSGTEKDQFHFFQDTAEYQQRQSSGQEAGYGVRLELISGSPPREIIVSYVVDDFARLNPNVVLERGASILSVDGVDVAYGSDVDTLNRGLFPEAGASHELEVRDLGATETRTINVTAGIVTEPPVLLTEILETDTGAVGYLVFNSFNDPSEAQLVAAIESFQEADVVDVVLDIRYNGGGLLAIASQLAYMLVGPGAASGRTFEELQFNDKYPNTNPVTLESLSPDPFLTTAVGFSVPANTALPWLELNRLFVLTTSATCSASESLINGLRGIDIPVYQFGSNTCGKPYGFYPQNNCGTTYFTIQFKGINAKGFGDYSEGFAPISDTDNTLSSDQLPGCTVGENYSPLGSGSESLLQSALAYRLNEGGCPASSSLATVTPTTKSRPVSSDQVIARPQRPGRILLREQP